MTVPADLVSSKAMQLITSRGWNWRVATAPQYEVENCFYCGKGGYHLRIKLLGADEPQASSDGLHKCLVCGVEGNLSSLKTKLGITIPGVESRKEAGDSGRKTEELPDLQAAHEALLENANAMDYLMNGRGFSRAIIEQQKIGFTPERYFRETGKVPAIIYPYLVNGNMIFCHYRTCPDMDNPGKVPKAFSSPTGWTVPLYNQEALLKDGLKDIIMVEGEANCIAAMDHGIDDICGVPGANFKKAEWIDVLDKLELDKIYICYDKDKVGQKAAQTLAAKIGIEKCWKITLPDFPVLKDDGTERLGKDLNEYFKFGGGTAESFAKLKEEAVLFDVDGVASSKDSLSEFMDELEGKEGLEPKYKSAWPSQNKLVGFDEGDVIDILAPEKVGKFLESTTYILMEDGSKRMIKDLSIGDRVASVDGKESKVTGVYPQGVQPMMCCTFADGRYVLAGKPHLWQIDSVNKWEGGPRVFTTDAIRQHHCNGRHPSKVHIPLASGDYGSGRPLPLDPWVLGALIGDGSFVDGSPTFTTTDEELARLLESRIAVTGANLNAIGTYRDSWSNGHIKASSKTVKQFVISQTGSTNSVTSALRDLGLWGHRANTKFIPKAYLQADKESRWELLRGLMDTDGTAGNKNGTPSYCTVSKQLAEDFVYLVRSLGGLAKIGKPQRKSFRYKGELRQGQDAYIIVARFPAKVRKDVFSLERKRKLVNLKAKNNDPRLTFEKIEYAGDHEAVCISVSHPSKLYITDDFIVTHNTTYAMNLMEHMTSTYGEDGVFICLEMTRARMARKWVSHKAGIADNLPKNEEESQALLAKFKEAVPKLQVEVANRDGDFYFCYPQYKNCEDVYNLMRACIRRYGVKWIAIDNIQRLADTTPRGQGRNRTEHLSEISKVISQIAKDYGVQIIRILQPNRIAGGAMVSTDNVDGSSQIAKDCDCMLTLHRPRIANNSTADAMQFDNGAPMEEEATFSDRMLLTVGLSRYSSGGRCELHMDGATSTVSEMSEYQKKVIAQMTNHNVGHAAQIHNANLAGLNKVVGKKSEPEVIEAKETEEIGI
jgi:replicative DNA helicase